MKKILYVGFGLLFLVIVLSITSTPHTDVESAKKPYYTMDISLFQ